jgi:hypothetical protein
MSLPEIKDYEEALDPDGDLRAHLATVATPLEEKHQQDHCLRAHQFQVLLQGNVQELLPPIWSRQNGHRLPSPHAQTLRAQCLQRLLFKTF